MTSPWNDTVTTGIFYINDKNELESADVLSADSGSLPIVIWSR